VRTTVADPAATRAPDLVDRRFRCDRPEPAARGGLQYTPMAIGGFGYTAFVIDAYAGLIPAGNARCPNRRCSSNAPFATPSPTGPDKGARWAVTRSIIRMPDPVHCNAFHRDADAERADPVGRHRRDALDNALAETTIGLYKTECVRDGSPFRTGPLRTLADLEDITSAWGTGTTRAGSCTASGAVHRQKPKASTTLTSRSDSTLTTRNKVCMKPLASS